MPFRVPPFPSLETLSNYLQSPFSSRSNSPTKSSSRPTTPSIPFSNDSIEPYSPHRRSPQIIETHHIRKSSIESPNPKFDTPETCMVNQYLVIRELGSGSYGNVLLVLNVQNQVHYACKVINKRRLKRQFQFRSRGQHNSEGMNMIKQEIAILKRLSRHRNIIALIEVLNDEREDNLFMSMSQFLFSASFLFFAFFSCVCVCVCV
ncbi:Calcium/calmodulin-dependent protein kinase kinase 1, partial [Coelomomyces lativittatus]